MDKQTRREFTQVSQLFQAGKIKQAKAAVVKALGRNPRAFFLHNIHGAIDGTMGNWKDACKHFKKALKAHPKSFEALRNLGNAERKLGELNAAQKNLVKSLQLNPKFANGWCSLGNVYLDKGQIDQALEAYRKALKIRPDFIEAAVNLLTQLDRSNRIDELRDEVASFEMVAPTHPVLRLYKGIILERDKAYEEALEMLNSVAFDYSKIADNATLELARLNQLAKLNDRLKNTDTAFDLFTKANALNNTKFSGPYVSAARFTKGMEARRAYYTPGFSRNWRTLSEITEAPVFMVGFPRSGTTLLDTFLRGHADVSVIEEQPMVLELRQGLGVDQNAEISRLDSLEKPQIGAVAKAYLRSRNKGEKTPVIIDKLPLNLAYAGEILRVFPNAKFILSLREPADAVFSSFMQSFKLNDAMATFDTPENAARTYDHAFRIWKQVLAELNPAVITCKYEDLIADPKASLLPITEFLGVDWDEGALDYQATAKSRGHIATSSYAQVVQPLYTSAKGRWARYAHLMPEAIEIITPWRKEFGYSD